MIKVPKLLLNALLFAPLAAPGAELPDGNATIRAQAGASEIVITTSARLAGTIDSLTWKGREFINSADHGRQLQWASNLYEDRRPLRFQTEDQNR